MFAWGTPKENRKNEGKETLIDASRTVLLMFGFLGFWIPLFCFCYLVLWLFLNTNQKRRWDAKKKIHWAFQNSSAIHLPHNVRVTCEAHPAWAGWRDACKVHALFTFLVELLCRSLTFSVTHTEYYPQASWQSASQVHAVVMRRNASWFPHLSSPLIPRNPYEILKIYSSSFLGLLTKITSRALWRGISTKKRLFK